METRPIAFECIQERIHSFICSSHSWQDVLSDHARFGVVPIERSTRDLHQPSTDTKLLKSMFSSVNGRYVLLRRRLYSKMRRKARRAAPVVDESESCALE